MGVRVTINSMTGFARAAGSDARVAWTWEARSVNAKSLDVRCRVPQGFDSVEQDARKAAGTRFRRGNISLNLNIERVTGTIRYAVNRDLMEQVLALRADFSDRIDSAPPTLEGLMAIRGMLEPVKESESEAEIVARDSALNRSLDEVLDGLASARAEEGARLDAVVRQHVETIGGLVARAAGCAAAQPDAIRTRLQALVDELLGAERGLSEERLAQEAALLVGKADIREELDRLRAHIEAAGELLSEDAAIGRRFDFLCQEFNREANTLCSKSASVELTRIGLELKASIEQLREQIQNVE
jgi:uncharacterized protein (TIGR00255 family)